MKIVFYRPLFEDVNFLIKAQQYLDLKNKNGTFYNFNLNPELKRYEGIAKVKGLNNNRCYKNSLTTFKSKGFPIIIGFILKNKDHERILNKDNLEELNLIDFTFHCWNDRDGKIYDPTLGGTKAKKYCYYGTEIPEEDALNFNSDGQVSEYLKSKLNFKKLGERKWQKNLLPINSY